MKKIEQLYKEHRFEEIIAEYRQSEDIVDQWYYVASLVSLSRFDEALSRLEDHRDFFFLKTPKKWMKTYLDLLLMQNKFGLAYQKIAEWETFPYVSMEVEEMFPLLKKHVEEAMEQAFQKEEKGEDLHHLLSSSSSIDIYRGLQRLYTLSSYEEYLPELHSILENPNLAKSVQSLTLLLLFERKDSSPWNVCKGEKTWTIVPATLKPLPSIEEISRRIDYFQHTPNVTIASWMKQIWSGYVLAIYPAEIKEEEQRIFMSALESLAYEYMNEPNDELVTQYQKEGILTSQVEAFLYDIRKEMRLEQERMGK